MTGALFFLPLPSRERGGVRGRITQRLAWCATFKLPVNAVSAVARPPPAGETPLCWQWLTSEPVDRVEAVQRVLRYYALRWRVEDFHKAWKSGAGVAARQMQTADNLERIAADLTPNARLARAGRCYGRAGSECRNALTQSV